MTLHPLRCETCEFQEFHEDKIYTKVWCKKFEVWLTSEYNSITGCASHSDAISERKKVLDELEQWIMGMQSDLKRAINGDFDFTKATCQKAYWLGVERADKNLLKKIIELREQGGEQK